MQQTEFTPYTQSELDILFNEPGKVCDQLFMLHAAYALSCLFELCADETGDDEEFFHEEIWGITISQRVLDRLVEDVSIDFEDAVINHKPIRIWGKSYSIRKVSTYNNKLLRSVFLFPLKNGEYTITKEGVLNLAASAMSNDDKYRAAKSQSQINRAYLRQIIKLAEDDQNDGWNKLTDMEIVVYCWALFYNKHHCDNLALFKDEYADYLYVKDGDIINCVNEKGMLRGGPTGMCAFSYEKVVKWNKANKQKSYAYMVTANEADDYWYDNALKGTFAPV